MGIMGSDRGYYFSRFVLSALLLCLFFGWLAPESRAQSGYNTDAYDPGIGGKKIALILPSRNFQHTEYKELLRMLEYFGVDLTIASDKKGKARGSGGTAVDVGNSVAQLSAEDYEAFILVGGRGARQLSKNKAVLKLLRQAYEKGRVVAGVGVAPLVMAEAGILDGKKATVWSGLADQIKAKGAQYIQGGVVVDRNVVTAADSADSEEMAKVVADILSPY